MLIGGRTQNFIILTALAMGACSCDKLEPSDADADKGAEGRRRTNPPASDPQQPDDPILPPEIANINEVQACEARAAAVAAKVEEAWTQTASLTAENVVSQQAALDAVGLTASEVGVWTSLGQVIGDSVEVKVKAAGAATAELLTADLLKQAKIGTLFEVSSAKPLSPSKATDDTRFLNHSHFIYLGWGLRRICEGPSSLRHLGSLKDKVSVDHGILTTKGRQFVLTTVTPERQVQDTINTCAVDSGIRCQAEALTDFGFLFTNDANLVISEQTVTYAEKTIQVNTKIISRLD